VAFYSFKGGVGRSTVLLGTALALVRENAQVRVAILDLDLEAPGLAPALDLGVQRGVVDWLVDHAGAGVSPPPLSPSQAVVDRFGQELQRVDVYPAGSLGLDYLDKLSRLDFLASPLSGAAGGGRSPVEAGLRELLAPWQTTYDWVLVDCRAGLHDLSGLSMYGLAHADVLVARSSRADLAGLALTIDALGRPADAPVLVLGWSMVPVESTARGVHRERFVDGAFSAMKHAGIADDTSDRGDVGAPWDPVEFPLRPELMNLGKPEDLIGHLSQGDFPSRFAQLAQRLRDQLLP
jgi:cellulose biosynthesis protein BcsQ